MLKCMVVITERAAKYAVGKTNDAIDKAIAQAYADGYRDGYKDREAEIPVDLRDNKNDFIDLGLLSGTLWSSEYEKDGDKYVYSPYNVAETKNIPSIEQLQELFKCCKIKAEDGKFYFVGTNGNYISFSPTGYKEVKNDSSFENPGICYFWCKEDQGYNAGAIGYNSPIVWKDPRNIFTGYKLPIRLVKTK